jgi:hypothetical protein
MSNLTERGTLGWHPRFYAKDFFAPAEASIAAAILKA